MKYHMIAFIGGFLLDNLFGDPYWLPHPIRLIGSMISTFERLLLGEKGMEKDLTRAQKRLRGNLLVCLVALLTITVTFVILFTCYRFMIVLGVAVEMLMTYQILALKCLRVESMKVYQCLKTKSLAEAQAQVAMIVGRDTKVLDREGVMKATIETVAENTSDGVIAPLLYLAIGGPVLAFFYKAINTMDSMVGYKNERYIDFGRTAARLDDVANFIPSRIAAVLMIISCFFLGSEYSAKNAFGIYLRDRRKHASPNSAQTESVCAGALGIQLAGNASYFGKIVEKPFIGDRLRVVEENDIVRANKLMYATAFLAFFLLSILLYFI